MDVAAIHIRELGFRYRGQSSNFFSSLNLEILPGKCFGLFGPNGAGKTTLIHCMTGLLSLHEGNILLLGHDVSKEKRKIKTLYGFVPQEFSFYQDLSPVQNLAFFGAWSGLNKSEIKSKTNELLELLGLTEVRNIPVRKFSGGMKRRLNLAIGVIHDPRILFLDEPTVGVDIQTRHAMIVYLKELNRQGTTLIYTSHQLNEAEELCDDIAMIESGKIIARDSLMKLYSDYGETSLESLYLKLTGKIYQDV